MKNISNICVFCGSKVGENQQYENDAKKFGALLGEKNIGLVYGGGRIGLMGIIADAVTEEADPNRLALGTGTLTITADANHTVTGNAVSLGLGAFTVNIDTNVTPSGNSLTLATGNVTITAGANVLPTGNALSLDTVEPGVITWNDIIPGATMVWTPIKPY